MNQEHKDWQDKSLSHMSDYEKTLATSNIVRAQQDLSLVYLGCAERAIKALFLVNGGGVITTLAYISPDQCYLEKLLLILSFFVFLIGLILVLFTVKYDFEYMLKKLWDFGEDRNKFLLESEPFSIIKYFTLKSVSKRSPITIIIGKASFWCAIIGITLGVIGYLWKNY